MKLLLLILAACLSLSFACTPCAPSITTASGMKAPKGAICAGQIIFEDHFDSFDLSKWQHEITLGGGGNWEFQWYTNNRNNSFVEDGYLNLRPTLTSDYIGEAALYSATINLLDGVDPDNQCTNDQDYGCLRTGNSVNIINPIRSAKLQTTNTFSFRYGKASIRAKIPRGDWIWPALWFMPKVSKYGQWPRSGEIDLMESRSNRQYVNPEGINIGAEQVGSTMHFGPDFFQNGWPTSHFERNLLGGYDKDFHVYTLEWTPDYLKFSVDDVELGTVPTGDGYWARGGFEGINPYAGAGKDAPFDHEFFIIMNLAVGGTGGYFPDGLENADGAKPWNNNSPQAATDFWERRSDWLPTWKLEENRSKDASMLVDYVKVWAL